MNLADAFVAAHRQGAAYVPIAAPPPPPDVVAPFNLLAGECAQVVAMAEEVMDAWVQVLEQRPKALMRLCAIEQAAKPGMPLEKPVAELTAEVALWQESLELIRAGITKRGAVLQGVQARIEEASTTLVTQEPEFRRRARACLLRKLTSAQRDAAKALAAGATRQVPLGAAKGDEPRRPATQGSTSPRSDEVRANMRAAGMQLAKDTQATREKIDPTRVNMDAVALWKRTHESVRITLEHMRALLRAEANSLREQASLVQLQCEAHQGAGDAVQVLVEHGAKGALSGDYSRHVCHAVDASSTHGGALSGQSAAVNSCGYADALLKDAMSAMTALGALSN